jgi:hypothetical protein
MDNTDLDLIEEKIKNLTKDKPKDFSKDIDNINEKLKSIESHKHEHVEPIKEDKHEHAVHSWDKTCSDCGESNPDYSDKQYQCIDCDEPMGTKNEAEKAKACPHCSSDEGAYNEEEGYTF